MHDAELATDLRCHSATGSPGGSSNCRPAWCCTASAWRCSSGPISGSTRGTSSTRALAERTGLRFGWVVILVGAAVLLLWIPLRQRPGIGTVSNVIVIGLAVEARAGR